MGNRDLCLPAVYKLTAFNTVIWNKLLKSSMIMFWLSLKIREYEVVEEATHLYIAIQGVHNVGATSCLQAERAQWYIKAGHQNTEKDEDDHPGHTAEHSMQQYSYAGDTRKYQGGGGIVCINPVKLSQQYCAHFRDSCKCACVQKGSMGQFGLLRCLWANSRRSVKEHRKRRHMEIFRSPFTD